MNKSFIQTLLLSVMMLFILNGCTQAELDDTAPEHFVICAEYKDNFVNFTPIADDAIVVMWNQEKKMFEECDLSEETTIGNFVKVSEKNDKGIASKVEIVLFEDRALYWDEDAVWADGAGADSMPVISDHVGREIYSAENMIPMGERILEGFKFEDFSGVNSFRNWTESTYWSDIDYYNAACSDTLTILTGYKTYQQTAAATCCPSCIVTLLEWYGVRNGLNDMDIAALRGAEDGECFGRGSDIDDLENVFANLTKLGITGEWDVTSSDQEGCEDLLLDPQWIQDKLVLGQPIIVGWNSYGCHGQTIIGYDTMGTDILSDDVVIMMDPYDTTDHNNDGYTVESYERMASGVWRTDAGEGVPAKFITAVPADGWEYQPTMGDGIPYDHNNNGTFTDDNKLPYGRTSQDLRKYYPDTEDIGSNGLAGPASSKYERSGDHNFSPYYKFFDFYNMKDSDTLKILTNFKTIQQATEWCCGLSSASVVMNWYGLLEDETALSLASKREEKEYPGTYLSDMEDIFTYMNDEYGHDWVWFTNQDLDEPYGQEAYLGDYCLQAGIGKSRIGLIPYLLENDIPIMIGWDEWGGHWQVIVGYDNMGTPETTTDDILILADSYDTTDHNQDGYVIESFNRLVYGWSTSYDKENHSNEFIVAFPSEGHGDVIDALGFNE